MISAVMDANVIASWFLLDERGGKHSLIFKRVDQMRIHVPSVFPYEFLNILWNAQKRKRIDRPTAFEILKTVTQYPILVETASMDLEESSKLFELARTHDLTAYDAAYLELAVRLNLPLITYDEPLLNTARKSHLKTAL